MRPGGKIIPELFAEGFGCVGGTGKRPLSSAAHSRMNPLMRLSGRLIRQLEWYRRSRASVSYLETEARFLYPDLDSNAQGPGAEINKTDFRIQNPRRNFP